MAEGNDQGPRSQAEESAKASAETIQTLSGAMAAGAKQTIEFAERFSKKEPGAQASMLGVILLAVALLFAVLGAVTVGGEDSGFQFKMERSVTLSILAVGTLLIIVGGAFNVYFSVKVSAMWAKKGEAEQAAIRDLAEKADEAHKESISVIDRMLGKV